MYEGIDKREFVCIVCPVGCRLSVDFDEQGEVLVSGNKCPRGETYAREEVLAPKRTVTATCSVSGGRFRRIPVKTDAALPVELIDDLLAELYELSLQPPLRCGHMIIENYRESGVNVVATRSIEGS
jgi:CxxC motif-containing protein